MRLKVAALTLLVAGVCRADSDGYFCIGPAYVAYETRLATDAAEHRLHIVRIGTGRSLLLDTVMIPDFQVHGMRCDATAVRLDGWDATYELDLAPPHAMRRVDHPPGALRNGFERRNLAQWNTAAGQDRTERIALPWEGILLEVGNRGGENPCEFIVSSRIIGTSSPHVLLERRFARDCH